MSDLCSVTRLSLVVSASTPSTATILLGRTGGGPTFGRLITKLEDQGHKVIERTSSPVGAHGSADDLEEIDVVLLAVRDNDDVGAIGPIRPFQRVARDAGVLQGAVGMDRVMLLVEEPVTGLTADLGVTVLRYPRGAPEDAAGRINERVQQVMPEPETGMGRKLALVERPRSSGLLAPFVLFGLIGLVALIGAFVVALSSLGGDDDGPPEGAGLVQLIDVTDALRADAPDSSDVDAPAGPSAGADAGIVPGQDAGGSGTAADPSVGANQLYPATCVLTLSRDAALAAESPCVGAGVLEVEGSDGPWHNELRLLALADGVVGEVVYESGDVEPLGQGVVTLDAAAASFGVSSLTLTFSGPDQHVHLRTGADPDDREATLTLRLDR
jgi:hypothetical protein